MLGLVIPLTDIINYKFLFEEEPIFLSLPLFVSQHCMLMYIFSWSCHVHKVRGCAAFFFVVIVVAAAATPRSSFGTESAPVIIFIHAQKVILDLIQGLHLFQGI